MKAAEIKKRRNTTGEGGTEEEVLTPLEERLVALMGTTVVEGKKVTKL